MKFLLGKIYRRLPRLVKLKLRVAYYLRGIRFILLDLISPLVNRGSAAYLMWKACKREGRFFVGDTIYEGQCHFCGKVGKVALCSMKLHKKSCIDCYYKD